MKAGSASSDACNAARSWQPPVHLAQISSDDPWKNAKWQEVPVVGLANCGDGSWYTPGNLPLRATMPVDYPYTPNMFAVLAVGTSMQPEGIKQGYVLFCDPSAGIDVGDAVYVEKADGSASVKKYLKNDNGKIHLQGWSEPKDGTQKPYFEEVAQSQIKRLACVVVVKRKG